MLYYCLLLKLFVLYVWSTRLHRAAPSSSKWRTALQQPICLFVRRAAHRHVRLVYNLVIYVSNNPDIRERCTHRQAYTFLAGFSFILAGWKTIPKEPKYDERRQTKQIIHLPVGCVFVCILVISMSSIWCTHTHPPDWWHTSGPQFMSHIMMQPHRFALYDWTQYEDDTRKETEFLADATRPQTVGLRRKSRTHQYGNLLVSCVRVRRPKCAKMCGWSMLECYKFG